MVEISITALERRGPSFKEILTLDDVRDWELVRQFGAFESGSTTLATITTAGVYHTPAAPTSLEIVSTDLNDTAAGTGLRTVEIEGIGSDWTEQIEVVALNGVTPVPLANTWLRVYKMRGLTEGTYSDESALSSYAGEITLREAGAGPTWATIAADGTFGLGKSKIGCYTIPRGKTGYLAGLSMTPEAAKNVSIFFLTREGADLTAGPDYTVAELQQVYRNLGAPFTKDHEVLMGPLVGPCDVIFMGRVDTGSTTISVDFNLFLSGDKDL